ncbi:hypothetical protein HAX54_010951 [Datura stramonium]|uniref:Uncharacterized protein n=1 Tax=Datura stramonium TaxID=4076 RepID=A0ABS8TH24_DATST|nr:hypothetical protein [Datura stramonium]
MIQLNCKHRTMVRIMLTQPKHQMQRCQYTCKRQQKEVILSHQEHGDRTEVKDTEYTDVSRVKNNMENREGQLDTHSKVVTPKSMDNHQEEMLSMVTEGEEEKNNRLETSAIQQGYDSGIDIAVQDGRRNDNMALVVFPTGVQTNDTLMKKGSEYPISTLHNIITHILDEFGPLELHKLPDTIEAENS